MNKKYTADEAARLEKKLTVGFTTVILLFVNVCLPVLVIGGVLYWIFGR
jgi:hypothetical protein